MVASCRRMRLWPTDTAYRLFPERVLVLPAPSRQPTDLVCTTDVYDTYIIFKAQLLNPTAWLRG